MSTEYFFNPDDWQRFEVYPIGNKGRVIGKSVVVLARNANDAADRGLKKLRLVGPNGLRTVSVHAYHPALDRDLRGYVQPIPESEAR